MGVRDGGLPVSLAIVLAILAADPAAADHPAIPNVPLEIVARMPIEDAPSGVTPTGGSIPSTYRGDHSSHRAPSHLDPLAMAVEALGLRSIPTSSLRDPEDARLPHVATNNTTHDARLDRESALAALSMVRQGTRWPSRK